MNNEKQLMFLYEILTQDKGTSRTMAGPQRDMELLVTITKRLLKSRASEYSFEIHDDGYLLITRL